MINPKPIDLFPTRIWTFECAALRSQHPDWIAELEKRRRADESATGRSTRQGWSGPKTLFDDPAYESLRATVNDAVVAAFREMGVPSRLDYHLEAWANMHDTGGFNYAHTHREALLSGCYYLEVPPGGGAIVFKDPRPGTLHSRPLGKGVNSWQNIVFRPAAGSLLLFPNWLEHAVEPNEAASPRFSIAFNAVPRSANKNTPAVPR